MTDRETTPEADAGLVKLDDERKVMDLLAPIRHSRSERREAAGGGLRRMARRFSFRDRVPELNFVASRKGPPCGPAALYFASAHPPPPPSEGCNVGSGLARSVFGLWTVVNDLTRVRPVQRKAYRVTIFGSARVERGHWVYEAVRDLGAELTRLGCDIVTGGGPGLMQAANEGARIADPEGRQQSVGIRVELPFEQEVNAFVNQAYEHGTFFTRLHHFALVSDAFVVVPGGIGTVLEMMMIWQLLQVRKLYDTPLIVAGAMWGDLVEWARRSMLRPDAPLASPEDMAIPHCVTDGAAIVRILREHHALWKSRQQTAR